MRIKQISLLCFLLLLSACTPSSNIAPDLIVPLEAPADLVPALRTNMTQIKLAEGTIVPHSEGLSFSVEGMALGSVNVRIGQRVSMGTVLATLDDTQFAQKYDELSLRIAHNEEDNDHYNALRQYSIDALSAEISSASSDYQRQLLTFDLRQAKEELAYQTQLQSLDQNHLLSRLEKMNSQREAFSLVAPFDGVIMHIESVELGAYPNINKPFIYLADLGNMTIQCTSETNSFFSQALSLQASIGENTFDIELLQYTHDELMAFYFASVSPPVRFRPILSTIELTADKRALLAVRGEERENVLTVLPNAVHQESSEGAGYVYYVYTDNNGARERRNIKCGLRSDVAVEVLEGLEEGEIVYVD